MAEKDVSQDATNVLLFPDRSDGPRYPEKSAALLLALLVWNEQTPATKLKIKRMLRDRAASPAADDAVIELCNLLGVFDGHRPAGVRRRLLI